MANWRPSAPSGVAVTPAFSAPPTIINGSPLPEGETGLAYALQLVVANAVGGFTVAITAGSLPAGLNLASNGVISGTPTTVTIANVTFQVTDSISRKSTPQAFQLQIITGVSIRTASPLPAATQNTAYSTTLAAAGGQAPYTWQLLSAVPNTGGWINLNQATGVISGTPAAAETETLSIQVTEALGASATKSFSLTVNTVSGQLAIVTSSLPNGLVGSAYSAPLVASGGTQPYSWTLISASPNTDLWLNVQGANLVGTPELNETESVTLMVTDATNATVQATFSLVVTVSGALSIVTPAPGYYSAASALIGGVFALRMIA